MCIRDRQYIQTIHETGADVPQVAVEFSVAFFTADVVVNKRDPDDTAVRRYYHVDVFVSFLLRDSHTVITSPAAATFNVERDSVCSQAARYGASIVLTATARR